MRDSNSSRRRLPEINSAGRRFPPRTSSSVPFRATIRAPPKAARYYRLLVALFNARSIRRMARIALRGVSSHSHIRIIRHPAFRRLRVTNLSRAMLLSNFRSQNSVRLFGVYANLQPGCRCQKQPSTKTAIRSRRNTKSGLPNTRWPRRQPRTSCNRNKPINRSSVSRFPLDRIRDMTADRFSIENTSELETRVRFGRNR
jgi:hypothetical protein